MDYTQALAFLDSFQNYEKGMAKYNRVNYRPEKTRELLDKAGLDDAGIRIFHIAGTKGKGSTASYLSKILEESGEKAGLYTSPHLYKINERIKIQSDDITDEDFASLITDYSKLIETESPTYFEALTFLGMAHFIRSDCRAVILETGLGGRLDATNFCRPAVSVITSIGFDHTAVLGNTLGAIAREKAGIIKPHVPCVIARQSEEAMREIRTTALERLSPFYYLPDYAGWSIGNRSADLSALSAEIRMDGKKWVVKGIPFRQTGDVFAEDFVLAVLAALTAGIRVEPAFARKAAALQLPGRMEKRGNILFDVAHNDSSFQALFQSLDDYYPGIQKDLYIGILSDKEIGRLADVILESAGNFDAIGIFDFPAARPSGGKALFEKLLKLKNIRYYRDITGIKIEPDHLSVFAGSFYTADLVWKTFQK